jgi:hypothetical protein
MMTARIAATDEHPASILASHVDSVVVEQKVRDRPGSSRASPVKARHKPASIAAFPDIPYPFRYSLRDTLR